MSAERSLSKFPDSILPHLDPPEHADFRRKSPENADFLSKACVIAFHAPTYTKSILLRKAVEIMNGTFDVTLLTPVGPQRGVLKLADENGALHGSISAMGYTNYLRNGKANGNSFELSGVLSAGFFSIRYSAKGTVDGDTLKAKVTTDSGIFQMNGTRTA